MNKEQNGGQNETPNLLVEVGFIPGKSYDALRKKGEHTHVVTANVTQSEYDQLTLGGQIKVVRSPIVPFSSGRYYMSGKGRGSIWAVPIHGKVLRKV